jgi:predicted dienelactone hydrolase
MTPATSFLKGNSMMAVRASVLIVGALAVCLSGPVARADAIRSTSKVGVTSRQFVPAGPYNWRAASTHVLRVTVWYPAVATAREKPQWLGHPHPFARAGDAAPDATPAAAPRRFPLIVISHGTGGTALGMAWLGTRLAAHGFIAVAVNHPGNNALGPYTPQGFTLWWLRAKDLSVALDGMLSDREFGPRIDARRIGAAGFSLGGYTMIEIAGGRTSPAIFDLCEKRPHDPACTSPPEFPTLVPQVVALLKSDHGYRAAIGGASQSYRDPRVRAAFAIAPALGGAFIPDSLARISIPVEIVAGSADPIEPVNANARYIAAHIPGSHLVLFPGAGHYTFFATCTVTGRKSRPQLCGDPRGIDRDRIHERAGNLAVTFFSAQLK